jgi:hemolysin activation/secretion protein
MVLHWTKSIKQRKCNFLRQASRQYRDHYRGLRDSRLGRGQPDDQGYLLTGEFRWLLPQASKSGNAVYLANFYDYGEVEINQEQWDGSGDGNRRSLSDAGLGLIWARQGFNLRLDYAHKLGSEKAQADSDSDGRFWLQCVKYF